MLKIYREFVKMFSQIFMTYVVMFYFHRNDLDWYSVDFLRIFRKLSEKFITRGGHKPGKHRKAGKLRQFEKLMKSQGKLEEIRIFVENLENSRKMVKYVTMKMYSSNLFYLELLREKFGNALEISVSWPCHAFILQVAANLDTSGIPHLSVYVVSN